MLEFIILTFRWCGPCKILAPRLEKVVAKHQGKVLMAKVDIDDNTDLALEYEVCLSNFNRIIEIKVNLYIRLNTILSVTFVSSFYS